MRGLQTYIVKDESGKLIIRRRTRLIRNEGNENIASGKNRNKEKIWEVGRKVGKK